MDSRNTPPSITSPKTIKRAVTKEKRMGTFSADSAGIELRPTGPICRDCLNGQYRLVRYTKRYGVIHIFDGNVGELEYDAHDANNDFESTRSRAIVTCRRWIAQHPEEVLAKAKAGHARGLASGSKISGE